MTSHNLPAPSGRRRGVSARTRLLVALVVGVLVGVGVSVPGTWQYRVLLGWVSAAAVFLAWMWVSIWPMDASQTASHAGGENPGRALTDVVMLGAAVASLLGTTGRAVGGRKQRY